VGVAPQRKKAMQSQASVEIDRPIEEVFRLTNDQVVQWSNIVKESVVLELKPEGVGTIFKTVTEDRGRRMEFLGVVTRYEPPHASAVFLRGPMFNVEAEYHFEDLHGRTRVTQTSKVAGKGFLKVFFFLLGWAFKKPAQQAAQAELEGLKRYCEQPLTPPTPAEA
jgi:hypothetical protein